MNRRSSKTSPSEAHTEPAIAKGGINHRAIRSLRLALTPTPDLSAGPGEAHGLEVHLAHPLGLNGATAGAEATSPTPLQNPVAQSGAHNAPGTPAPGYQITSEQGRE